MQKIGSKKITDIIIIFACLLLSIFGLWYMYTESQNTHDFFDKTVIESEIINE